MTGRRLIERHQALRPAPSATAGRRSAPLKHQRNMIEERGTAAGLRPGRPQSVIELLEEGA